MKKLMCNLLACASLASIGDIVASASETTFLPVPDPEIFNDDVSWVKTGEGLYQDILENRGMRGLDNEVVKCLYVRDFKPLINIIDTYFKNGYIKNGIFLAKRVEKEFKNDLEENDELETFLSKYGTHSFYTLGLKYLHNNEFDKLNEIIYALKEIGENCAAGDLEYKLLIKLERTKNIYNADTYKLEF